MERNEALEQSITSAKKYVEEAQSASVTSTYPIQSVQWAGKSTYCSELVLATNEEFGRMLITDKEMQSTQSDEAIYHEHLVQPAIIAYRAKYGNSKALRVLVLGAGEGATIREVVRHENIEVCWWSDIDPDLVNLCEEHLQYVPKEGKYYEKVYNTPDLVKRMYEDANELLKNRSQEPWDIIISDLPDPVLGDTSSLYGTVFWKNIFEITADKCIISTHSGPIGPSEGMATQAFLSGQMTGAGFKKPAVSKVAIPSFQVRVLSLIYLRRMLAVGCVVVQYSMMGYPLSCFSLSLPRPLTITTCIYLLPQPRRK